MDFFTKLTFETQIALVTLASLITGSFISLLTVRITNNEPITFTRSKCVNCKIPLKAINLIPLFSWLIQRGRCSNCKVKISIRYPLIELSFLVSFLAIFFTLDQKLDTKMLLYFAIISVFIFMCVIDLENYYIPDLSQYVLTALATILVIYEGSTSQVLPNVKSAFIYLGFGIALWIFFYYAGGLEAIGIDDIKFFFIAGFMLGDKNFLTFMILSGMFGAIFGAIWEKLKEDECFPFAPAICCSTFVCLLFGQKIEPIEILGSLLFL